MPVGLGRESSTSSVHDELDLDDPALHDEPADHDDDPALHDEQAAAADDPGNDDHHAPSTGGVSDGHVDGGAGWRR
jgi:hypothetical protein